MKGIGITHKLSITLLLYSLITIYKSFVRPRYGDKIYDQPNNESFTQYLSALAISDAIKGTSQNKLYSELGFESLKFRRCFRKL